MPAAAPGRHKYDLLLALLLISLIVQSTVVHGGVAGQLTDALRTVLTVTMFLVVFARTRERRWIAAFLLPTVGLGWIRQFAAPSLEFELRLSFNLLMGLFLWATVAVILRDLFRRPNPGVQNVLGAICGYLIAADAWSMTHLIAYQLAPASYSINAEIDLMLPHWHSRLALFSYYSLAQMLSIGYSDITPVQAPATTLSLLGSLFGMFYTAIVVSQFVGLAQDRRRDHDDSSID
jgi:hypothetical protein